MTATPRSTRPLRASTPRRRARRAAIAVSLLALVATTLTTAIAESPSTPPTALWDAARDGDLETLKNLAEQGADLDARTRYGASALSFAADRGHVGVVRFLIEEGVDLAPQDTFYSATPLRWSLMNEHPAVALALIRAGAPGAGDALAAAVRFDDAELVRACLAAEDIDADAIRAALTQAKAADRAELVAILEAVELPEEAPAVEVPQETLEKYVGRYANKNLGLSITVRAKDGALSVQADGQPELAMRALEATRFKSVDFPIEVSFHGRGGIIERAEIHQGGGTFAFLPVDATDAGAESAEADAASGETGSEAQVADAAPEPDAAPAPQVDTTPRPWPSFRGAFASGIADGQRVATRWSVEDGTGVLWKTAIPGIGNASPVIYGDRVYVATAVSTAGDDTFRTGLYGDVDSVDDTSVHRFELYALDRETGAIVWKKTAREAPPAIKRHLKSSHANSTPATDGEHVVVLFGSIGVLQNYSTDGELRWEVDLGPLDSGWFYDKGYQWGHASSPIVHDGLAIVQVDIQAGSYIAAYRLSDGSLAWRTERDEIPSWGTPTVVEIEGGAVVTTNGTVVRGYDAATGKERWRIGPNSEVTVGTPVAGEGVVYVTGGYPPVRPIYAVRPEARGDLTLGDEATSSEGVAWSTDRGGTYMPTPIVYRGLLYTVNNDGRLTCYDAATGERVFRARVGGGGSFTASPIAADGHLYFVDETGDVVVTKAGREYEEVATNPMGEVVMATPAASDGVLVIRTLHHVWGIGEPTAAGDDRASAQ